MAARQLFALGDGKGAQAHVHPVGTRDTPRSPDRSERAPLLPLLVLEREFAPHRLVTEAARCSGTGG